MRRIDLSSYIVLNVRTVEASYIGKTKRILYHRIKEHSAKKDSACNLHIENMKKKKLVHRFNFDKPQVLDSADSDKKLQLKELLHIIHHKPSLNKVYNPQSKFNIKTLIIAAYPQVTSETSATA